MSYFRRQAARSFREARSSLAPQLDYEKFDEARPVLQGASRRGANAIGAVARCCAFERRSRTAGFVFGPSGVAAGFLHRCVVGKLRSWAPGRSQSCSLPCSRRNKRPAGPDSRYNRGLGTSNSVRGRSPSRHRPKFGDEDETAGQIKHSPAREQAQSQAEGQTSPAACQGVISRVRPSSGASGNRPGIGAIRKPREDVRWDMSSSGPPQARPRRWNLLPLTRTLRRRWPLPAPC